MHFLLFMNKIVLFFISFLLTNQIISQNLVPNPSFEDYIQCPDGVAQIDRAIPWFSDRIHSGTTSEYYNLCNDFFNVCLETQMPRTKNGMSAIVFFGAPSSNTEAREYIEVKLNHPLQQNTSYCISFFVSLIGYATYGVDGFCSCFSMDSVINNSNVSLLNCPFLACSPSGEIIKDTLNWTKVKMNYISQGGEQFITLGNFKTYLTTNYENTGNSTTLYPSYYFIDDVSVYECDAPVYPANVPDQTPCKGETVTLGSQTRPQYLYEWKDASGNVISDQGSITIVADTSTYYVLKQKDFKFDETTDTCFITVDPFCLHIPNVITPNNDDINDFFVIDGSSELTVDLQLFNRWGKLVYHSKRYQNNWPVNDIADGVYFYIIKATSAIGEVREYQGSVSVIR